jgi:hypothetical protein
LPLGDLHLFPRPRHIWPLDHEVFQDVLAVLGMQGTCARHTKNGDVIWLLVRLRMTNELISRAARRTIEVDDIEHISIMPPYYGTGKTRRLRQWFYVRSDRRFDVGGAQRCCLATMSARPPVSASLEAGGSFGPPYLHAGRSDRNVKTIGQHVIACEDKAWRRDGGKCPVSYRARQRKATAFEAAPTVAEGMIAFLAGWPCFRSTSGVELPNGARPGVTR